MFWLLIWLAGSPTFSMATNGVAEATPATEVASSDMAPAADAPAIETPVLPDVAAAPCIACRAPKPPALATLARKQLEAGECWVDAKTEVGAESAGGASRAAVRVPRPPAEVWRVLTDFESWPDFMPLLDETTIPRNEGNRRWVRQKYSVMFVDMEHTTVYILDPAAGTLRWSLDREAPASIASSNGAWTLVPIENGAATLVHYESVVDSGRAVPEFVRDMLVGRSLTGMLGGLRDETERRSAESH